MTKRHALAAMLTLMLAATATAGIHLMPDATRDEVAPGRQNRTLLTWDLPEGLLVVDRRSVEAPAFDIAPFMPQIEDGQWYLVDRSRSEVDDIAVFGHVHLAGETVWLIEVAPARHDAFLLAGLSLQYLDLAPLAPSAAATVKSDAGPAPTIVDPAVKNAYVDALEQQAFNQIIREISGDTAFWYNGGPNMVTTRYYNTAGNDLVTEYLADKLEGYGYTVELDEFMSSGHLCHNVVATLPGSVTPEEIIVVGGHFDSTSPDAGSLAPGAEDNASGTSLVMEIARVSADREFERTVQFVMFDAEEIGLRGSQHFVDEAVTEGHNIVAAITADMVSYYDRNYGVTIEGQTEWEWLMTAMSDNVDAVTDIAFDKTYHSWGSDHVSFQQAGIAAFLAIDQDWSDYDYYHRTTDTWDKIEATAPLGLQISRAAAGTLADVAGLMDPGTSGVPVVDVPLVRLTAHPNPFNPMTTISFSLDVPTSGSLTIHDLSGRLVATVASGDFLAGEHTVRWTGTDNRGQAMSSGVYLARLQTSVGDVNRKLNLVR